MSLEREKARARGTAGEWLAAALLRAKGYRILARQFRALGGELDIVALTPPWSPRTIVFVEVRARGTVEQAIESVGAEKRRRVEAASSQFCVRKPKLNGFPRRYDLVLLAPGRWPHHVIDAWRP
ncbi:MAG: YraN family protein [Alphaproteobacteria bacterium]|nr:YraN family protein [Alphaproteobacteria bacterium]